VQPFKNLRNALTCGGHKSILAGGLSPSAIGNSDSDTHPYASVAGSEVRLVTD
jgi:hypothetical protein